MANAAETEIAEHPNQVVIEDAGPARKRIRITIPAEAVGGKLDDSYATLAGEATLPGFRKGRAPRRLIERRFGMTVLNETRNQLIADAYSRAIEEHKVRAVGEPEGDALKDLKVEPGKPLSFSVEVEVAPEFELPAFEGMKIKKPVVEVTEKHIDEEIARQLYRFGAPGELKDEVGAGDRMQGRAVITKIEDGSLVEELPEAVVAMPLDDSDKRGHVLGLFQEDMFALFAGKKVGDTVVFETTISENHERMSLRGAKIRVEYSINLGVHVERATPAKLVETFGLASEDALRAEIRTALEQRAKQEQQAAMREQLCEHLLSAVDFPLPEKMSERQASRQIDRSRVEMLYRGMTPDEVEMRIAEMRDGSVAESRNRLKLFFILHRLAEQFNVEVSDQEINGRVAALASQRGERPEKLRAQLVQEGKLQQIAQQIREHKAMDKALERTSLEEVAADEWNKAVKERTPAAKPGGGAKAGAPKRKETAEAKPKAADSKAAQPKASTSKSTPAKSPAPKSGGKKK